MTGSVVIPTLLWGAYHLISRDFSDLNYSVKLLVLMIYGALVVSCGLKPTRDLEHFIDFLFGFVIVYGLAAFLIPIFLA